MKYLKKITLLSVIVVIYSCAPRQMFVGPLTNTRQPIVQINYFAKKDSTGQEPEVFNPPVLYSGKKKIFFPKSQIEIKPNHIDSLPIGIRLGVSSSPNSESQYTEIVSGQSYQNLFDGEKYTITSPDLYDSYSYKLPNNRFLKVEAYKKIDSTIVMTGFFRIQKKYSFFTGFSSPILFRVSGNAAGFNLNSISPSLGFNFVQRNFSNTHFDHLSLDMLVTITSYPEDLKDSYQYTMAVGGVVDFGGYIQLGSSYSFLEKKPYLVVGIKPYLFSKLFGSDR